MRGVANNDTAKQAEFNNLQAAGYEIRALERKSYIQEAVYKEVKCKNCKTTRRVQVLKRSVSLKSNVDVYLATDLLKIAYLATRPTQIILVACDGDYAEMIKSALETNRNISIKVIATPVVPQVRLPNGKFKNINSCSTRLQKLKGEKYPSFYLVNIRDIQDYIQKQE